jgi:small subunit ribosomal protein S14
MAKKSAIENNQRKRGLAKKFAARRKRLLDVANDQARPMEERFEARIRLAALPRNGAIVRVRNRCEVTGRPRGFYRKVKMSRIALRELGNQGLIPGLVKSSW